jgi:molybdopterin-guanine dinucleotide biosynthesis protein A
MNGQDKGLALFHGRPLISHVIDRIKPQVHHLLINCNRSHDQYRAFGCPILTDTCTDTDTQSNNDFQGPLQGILSMATQFREQTPALEQNEYCMIVPCDMPFLPTDLVDRLQHAIKGHAAAYASTATGTVTQATIIENDSGISKSGWSIGDGLATECRCYPCQLYARWVYTYKCFEEQQRNQVRIYT